MASKKPALVSQKKVINPVLPRIPITLNGKEYKIEFSFNAIAVAEEATGMNLFATFDFTNLSVTKFRAMLYASLLKNHPSITLEECGDFVTIHSLPDITVKLVEAWHGSRPEVATDEDKDKEGNAEAEAAE